MGSDPRTPYRLLAAILLVVALVTALYALAPADHPELQALDAVVAGVLLVLAALTRFVGPHVPGSWGLDGVLLVITGVASYGATLVVTGEGQILIGLGLLLFAVFAAYFRPRSRFLLQLGAIVVGFGVAAVVNPTLRFLDAVAVVGVVVGVSVMVSVLADRLRRLALLDPLTGALNRRGLDALAGPLASTARRSGSPVTVGLVDLDDFKAYNDAHGHVAGDDLLSEVASAWRSALRSSDLLVRYGGDEFAVVLPGSDEHSAAALADRVRAVVPAAWTAGFTEWRTSEDLYAALARADASMLRRKRRGAAPPVSEGGAARNAG